MQTTCFEQSRHNGSSSTFTIAVGRWLTMIAHLLLAITESDAESRLGDELARARRFATLLAESPEVNAALSRQLQRELRGARRALLGRRRSSVC